MATACMGIPGVGPLGLGWSVGVLFDAQPSGCVAVWRMGGHRRADVLLGLTRRVSWPGLTPIWRSNKIFAIQKFSKHCFVLTRLSSWACTARIPSSDLHRIPTHPVSTPSPPLRGKVRSLYLNPVRGVSSPRPRPWMNCDGATSAIRASDDSGVGEGVDAGCGCDEKAD